VTPPPVPTVTSVDTPQRGSGRPALTTATRPVCKATQKLVKGECVTKTRGAHVLGKKKTLPVGVLGKRKTKNLPFTL
jgi:hypothetical protein